MAHHSYATSPQKQKPRHSKSLESVVQSPESPRTPPLVMRLSGTNKWQPQHLTSANGDGWLGLWGWEWEWEWDREWDPDGQTVSN